ncbi:hypothetical protein AU078_07225 [Streptococcus gallolyticus]|nr:hypothetical protein AU078_07225 [Streptococcus gallolyticus]
MLKKGRNYLLIDCTIKKLLVKYLLLYYIMKALDKAGERKSYRTIAELEAGKFKKTVPFITAKSATGKPSTTKSFCYLNTCTS